MTDYYLQKQMIATCDKNGNITGEIEKWEAHKKGILHRAYSVAVVYKNEYLVQHRKHIAFGGLLDITVSSHQLMVKGKFEDTVQSSLATLKREWNVTEKDLVKPLKNVGVVYYKAKDKFSVFTEHEVCDLLIAELKTLKEPNLEFAYGYSLITKKELKNKNSHFYQALTPWVKVMIEKKLL